MYSTVPTVLPALRHPGTPPFWFSATRKAATAAVGCRRGQRSIAAVINQATVLRHGLHHSASMDMLIEQPLQYLQLHSFHFSASQRLCLWSSILSTDSTIAAAVDMSGHSARRRQSGSVRQSHPSLPVAVASASLAAAVVQPSASTIRLHGFRFPLHPYIDQIEKDVSRSLNSNIQLPSFLLYVADFLLVCLCDSPPQPFISLSCLCPQTSITELFSIRSAYVDC